MKNQKQEKISTPALLEFCPDREAYTALSPMTSLFFPTKPYDMGSQKNRSHDIGIKGQIRIIELAKRPVSIKSFNCVISDRVRKGNR